MMLLAIEMLAMLGISGISMRSSSRHEAAALARADARLPIDSYRAGGTPTHRRTPQPHARN